MFRACFHEIILIDTFLEQLRFVVCSLHNCKPESPYIWRVALDTYFNGTYEDTDVFSFGVFTFGK